MSTSTLTCEADPGAATREDEHRSRVHPTVALLARSAAVPAVGLGVGVATSILQGHLTGPWADLVNAASPWLLPGFLIGALWRSKGVAAIAGLVTVVLEVVGYYATATVHGYTARPADLIIWTGCAILGGPLLGLAGRSWWRGEWGWHGRTLSQGYGWTRGLGAATIVGSFVAEALVVYDASYHYYPSARLFEIVAGLLFLALGVRRSQHLSSAAWLVATVPLWSVVYLAVQTFSAQGRSFAGL